MCMDVINEELYLFGGWDGGQDLADLWVYRAACHNWDCLSRNTADDVSRCDVAYADLVESRMDLVRARVTKYVWITNESNSLLWDGISTATPGLRKISRSG